MLTFMMILIRHDTPQHSQEDNLLPGHMELVPLHKLTDPIGAPRNLSDDFTRLMLPTVSPNCLRPSTFCGDNVSVAWRNFMGI